MRIEDFIKIAAYGRALCRFGNSIPSARTSADLKYFIEVTYKCLIEKLMLELMLSYKLLFMLQRPAKTCTKPHVAGCVI
jgi:hypothetical protein